MTTRRQLTGKLQRAGFSPENITLIYDDVSVTKVPPRQILSGGVGGLINDDTPNDIFSDWDVEADTFYSWEAVIWGREAGNGFRFEPDLSQAAQSGFMYYDFEDTSAVTGSGMSATANPTISLTATTNSAWFILRVYGSFLSHATNDGTFNFQVAQVTSGANATDVQGGSWLRLEKETVIKEL